MADTVNGYEVWVCPECGTEYRTPTGLRVLMLCPEWDFCPKYMVNRISGKKLGCREAIKKEGE